MSSPREATHTVSPLVAHSLLCLQLQAACAIKPQPAKPRKTKAKRPRAVRHRPLVAQPSHLIVNLVALLVLLLLSLPHSAA